MIKNIPLLLNFFAFLLHISLFYFPAFMTLRIYFLPLLSKIMYLCWHKSAQFKGKNNSKILKLEEKWFKIVCMEIMVFLIEAITLWSFQSILRLFLIRSVPNFRWWTFCTRLTCPRRTNFSSHSRRFLSSLMIHSSLNPFSCNPLIFSLAFIRL